MAHALNLWSAHPRLGKEASVTAICTGTPLYQRPITLKEVMGDFAMMRWEEIML